MTIRIFTFRAYLHTVWLSGMVAVTLLVLLPSAIAAKATSGPGRYVVAPIPAWTVPAPPTPVGREPRGSPMYFALRDAQVRLGPQGEQRFFRIVRVASESAGLQDAGRLQVEFNPAFEKLAIHELVVVRAGKQQNRLPDTKFRVLDRELGLEQSVYQGVATATAALDDVRVGDRVLFSFTITGSNPVLEGRLDRLMPVAGLVPTQYSRLIVEAPEARSLHYRMVGGQLRQPEETRTNGQRRMLWTFTDLPAGVVEDRAPSWYVPIPFVQLTEFADWRDVAKWASGVYATPTPSSAEIDRVVAKIMSDNTEPDKRLEAALDFVQRDIRYFALSLGESSHRPAPPATVLHRRFGDCKDKSGLLIAMLRRMSIDAYPALVSSRLRHTVGDFLPAVATFDHMIVAVPRVSGYLWLDGTNAFQAGSPEARDARWLGQALVVRDDGVALTAMPPQLGDASVADVRERYTVKTGGQAATLDLTINLSGVHAEKLRAVLKQKDQETVLSIYTDFYRRRFPAIRATVPASLRDDRDGKPVVITASFEVPGLFRYQNGILVTYAVNGFAMDLIPLPSVTSRRAPFYLSIPSWARLQSEYVFPETRRFPPPPPPLRVSGRQFTFGTETVANDRTVKVTSELRLSRETVTPAELTEYLTNLKRTQEAGIAPVIYPLVETDRINEIMRRRDLGVLPGFPFIARGTPAARLRARHQQALELLDEALASRVVDDRLRSDLRIERAVQLSYLGEKPLALTEIGKVLATMPERADALMTRAEIMARTGNYAESSQDIVRAQAAGADPLAVARLRGEVAYFTGDLTNAEAAWRELTSLAPAAERYYGLVWLALTKKKKGEGGEAVAQELDTLGGNDWPRPIAEHLAGRLTESKLLESIGKEDPETSIQRYCEAYFYLGQQALVAGRTAEAAEYFRKTINTDVQSFVEWQYATLELARMNGQGR